MTARELKQCDEQECEHCLGLIAIRMPVPSSGCDHLYYPSCCKVCKERERKLNPSEFDIATVRIAELEAAIHRVRTLWCDSKRDPETGLVDIKYFDQFEEALTKSLKKGGAE